MTRADTRTPSAPHGITIKENSSKNILRFTLVIAILTLIITASIVLKSPNETLDSTVISLPKYYSKLEGVDPEERDLFHGFRTSFLPVEEVMLASHKRSIDYDGNEDGDSFIWDYMEREKEASSRRKRMTRFKFRSEDYNSNEDNPNFHNDETKDHDQDSANEGDEIYNSEETSSQQENEGLESIVRPHTHVDRGPLDDVVEQIRGQPELEEGEMESTAHLYKPASAHSGIHAFWKGQGDKDTIRATQASIMRRHMDVGADPCHDFYQYACGNWAALNPIPADKAGYDTFEMLRENLDAVLKDLLEFNHYETKPYKSQYPGANLDLKYFSMRIMNERQNIQDDKFHIDAIKTNNENIFNSTNEEKYRYNWMKHDGEISEIVNHIHNFVHRRRRDIIKLSNITRSKPHRHLNKKSRSKYQRKSSIAKKVHNTRKKRSPKGKSTVIKPESRKKSHVQTTVKKYRFKRLTGVLGPPEDLANGDAALKAKFLFASCMNYEILQKRAHQPLLDLLNLLGGWPMLDTRWSSQYFDWLELMAKLRLYNNDILISEWVGPDIKNSDEYVIQFDQTSLGLPTRDYFLQDSNKVYLNAYKAYLTKIALLLGGDKKHVLRSADELIEFEIKLAKITSAPEDRRNVSELYKRMTLNKLEKLVPEIKWRRYLCEVMNRTVQPDETVVLFALPYVKHLVKLIDNTDPHVLANYLLWRFVRHRVNNLDDRFQSAKQQFYFILFGREQSPPRWKNCISQVNSNMGMALGSMFVKKHFDETSKNDTLTMTREIQQSFTELLHKIDWIDGETKQLAAQKVKEMMLRIGYPDFILSKTELNDRYKDVIIHPDKYFENILNILQHLTQMEQSRIGQPVNKTLWNTAPAVVNAYYSRNKNQIMFPAGILQPPFYHRDFPRSLNYGGIGVVIGHEITHGFDDKGRLFDCNGNLHRWWSDSAIEAFHQRAQCLIDQYGRYVVPEVHMKLDGVNTQGENIADNGGVKQAFRAYTHWVQKHGVKDETLPGLNHTHTQLFFINFAQVWCGAMRSEAMRNKLKTAVHSPGRFRVIGTLSNSYDFAREFQCPPGSPMNPKEKCTVWVKMVRARKYVVKRYFDGLPKRNDYEVVSYELPPLRDGDVLVKAEWISVDPYLRAYNSQQQIPYDQFSYQVGVVLESKDPKYPVGTRVVAHKGWTDHYIMNDNEKSALNNVPPYILPDLKGLSNSLGIGAVGMPGATAYFGFLEICQPKAGETVVVTGAAGAVGSTVGQIAKIKGCKVIGFVGSDKKVEWLEKELGFDKAFNYKKVNIVTALTEAAPNGVDCFFDNVGGETFSEVVSKMNTFGRVAVCGSISNYNEDAKNRAKVTDVQPVFLAQQLKVEGLIASRWEDRWPEAFAEISEWIRSGKLKANEQVTEGFDNLYDAFVGMLTGENFGKAVVKV